MATAVTVAALVALLPAESGNRPRPVAPALPSPVGEAPQGGLGAVAQVQAFSRDDAIVLTSPVGFLGPDLIRTSDGGRHWVRIKPEGGRDAMFFLDRNHGWMLTAPDSGSQLIVFRTSDGGESWNAAPAGLPEGVLTPALDGNVPDLRFVDRERGFITITSTIRPALLTTSDGGASWTAREVADPDGDRLQRFEFTSPDEGWGLFEHDFPRGPTIDVPVFHLLHTTDGGDSWTDVALPPGPVPPDEGVPSRTLELALPWFDGRNGVMEAFTAGAKGKAEYFYVTHDGGETWTPTGPVPVEQGAGSPIYSTSIVDASTWVVYSTSGQTASTTDGGKTWSVRSSSLLRAHRGNPPDISFSSATDGWAVVHYQVGDAAPGSALWRTTDGGASWTLVLMTPARDEADR